MQSITMSEVTPVKDEITKPEHDLEEVTKESARDRLADLLNWGFRDDAPTLIEALPAIGKSYGVVKWAAETGNPVTVFTERHDLYDQYESWATEDFDLTAEQLPIFHEDCSTVSHSEQIIGDYEGSQLRINPESKHKEIRKRVLKKYGQGASGRELHEKSTTYFGQKLPCQENGSCSYMEKLDRDRDQVDVLIGNFRQVFAEQYQNGRYIVFDEFPRDSFIQTFSSGTASKTASQEVSYSPELPFENWNELVEYDHKSSAEPKVTEWLDQHGHDKNRRPLYRGNSGQIDTRGPLLTEIAIRFEKLDNGWRRADLGKERVAVQSPYDQEVALLDPPPTEKAKGVVALDGTPSTAKWQLLLGKEMEHVAVLSEEQKRTFLQDVLELRLIQTSENTKPYLGGSRVTPDPDIAFIEAVKDREGKPPHLISSLTAIEDKYNDEQLNGIIKDWENYNNLKGSGQFETVRLGIVIGSPQPSDEDIEQWGALAGHSITRKEYSNGQKTKGNDLDFGAFGNEMLHDARENEVLQAAMRFGREEENGERGATVYIRTSAIPAWVHPEKDFPSIHSWDSDDGTVKVIKAIRDRDDWQTGEWKTGDIAEVIDDLSTRRVVQIHKEILEANGYIDSRRGGRGNAYFWSNNRLEEVGEYGVVSW